MPDWPIRQKSLNGEPADRTGIGRTCVVCHGSFIQTAPGKTGERGLWDRWRWYCSQEDYDKEHDG